MLADTVRKNILLDLDFDESKYLDILVATTLIEVNPIVHNFVKVFSVNNCTASTINLRRQMIIHDMLHSIRPVNNQIYLSIYILSIYLSIYLSV